MIQDTVKTHLLILLETISFFISKEPLYSFLEKNLYLEIFEEITLPLRQPSKIEKMREVTI